MTTTNSRFRDIGSILNTKAPAPLSPGPVETATATGPETTTATPLAQDQRPHRRRQPRQSATPASHTVGGGVRRVAFRLDPELYRALADRASAARVSHGQVVLDAVEDVVTSGDLAELVHPADEGAHVGLFPRLKDRPAAEASVPVEIRVDTRAAGILDGLAAELGAKNRTHLITAALRAYLSKD